MNGMRKTICLSMVIMMEGTGFASDWKNVVANITNPRMGVMQKLSLSAVTPIWSISSEAPKSISIYLGRSMTIIHIIQVTPTDRADA